MAILSSTDRIVALFDQGKDTNEISKLLNIPEAQAEHLLHRGLDERRQKGRVDAP